MKLIKKGLRGCWFYFWGHVLGLIYYDKKYLTGRWFQGKLNGLCAQGWEWVTNDLRLQKKLHQNNDAKYPVSPFCRVVNPENIIFDPDDLNNFQSYGVYYQAIGNITIGKGTYIAPNVGLITSNHDVHDLDNHMPPKSIVLGEKCWIGMNSVILPGVTLGAHTIVGAGSVVTKSFPMGKCIIAGNPAKVIRNLDINE